ncbi:tetratricopeptide repeat protein [Sphingomonas prati]|uniref:Tetratricopeptide repeat protein n=1 Tax=Sphingomonas prati TaxID=1843237 RepID=A0A7W9BTI3_9SPHN|nr:hypothetical protein [Sphingomonas prati]MBB5729846.1 hypothetical protein [Sphingomonas prati]
MQKAPDPTVALRKALIDCTADFDRIANHVAIANLAADADMPEVGSVFAALATLLDGFSDDLAAPVDAPLNVPAAIDDLASLPLVDPGATDLPSPADRADHAALIQLCRTLIDVLNDPAGDPGAQLAAAHASVISHLPYCLAEHVTDPLPALAERVAFNAVRYFFRLRYDLAYAPLGSSGLFHAVARLSRSGLGPYLGNAARCSGLALLDLVQRVARDRLEADGDAHLLWAVRMAPHLGATQRFWLVDALGDAGALPALRALFRSEIRRTALRLHTPIFWSLRDAAIDLGDPVFAADVQRHVAEGVADNAVEWIVLAEVEATVGRATAAIGALGRALSIDPDNHAARDKLAAIEAGRIGDLAVAGGFGSSKDRRLVRFMQRRASSQRSVMVPPKG